MYREKDRKSLTTTRYQDRVGCIGKATVVDNLMYREKDRKSLTTIR